MVTQAEPLIHPEAQFQNPAPIGPQEPIPSGVHDIEISWDRGKGFMRAIIGDKKWWFKELLGQAQLTGTDNARGRINIRAKAVLTDEQLVLWRPSGADRHPWVKGVVYPSSYQRLCYRRANLDWRLRDERETKRGNPNSLVFVKGYVGDLNVEWPSADIVAHIYHRGPWILCDPGCSLHPNGGWAHLYEEW